MGFIASTAGKDMDVNEFDIILKSKWKDINLKALYIYVDNTYVPGTDNSVGSYGTHENHIVRLIATLNF